MVPRSLAVLVLLFAATAQAADCPRAFHFAQPIITSMTISSAAYGDFNEDGRTDVVVQLSNFGTRIVTLNRGSVFQPLQREDLSLGDVPIVAAADVDGDHHLDLIYRRDSTIATAFGRGDGTFKPPVTTNLTRLNAPSWRLIDFDHDGRPDFVDLDFGGNGASYIKSKSDGTFAEVGRVDFTSAFLQGIGAAAGDFDGDGNVDVVRVATDMLTFQTSVLFAWNDGAFHFTQTQEKSADVPSTLVPLDIDGDGAEELVAIDHGALVVVRARGRKLSVERMTVAPPWVSRTMHNAAMVDLDGDGIRDIVFNSGSAAGVLWGTGGGHFRDATFYELPGSGGIAVTDVDGDGIPDLAATSAKDGLTVLYGASVRAGAPSANRVYPLDPSRTIALQDVDGDGIADLIGFTAEQGFPLKAEVMFGDGRGGFAGGAQLLLPAGYDAGTVGDFDGDGHADLAIAVNGKISVAFGTSGGFAAPSLQIDADSLIGSMVLGNSTPPALVALRGDDVVLLTISSGRNVTATTIYHRPAGARVEIVHRAPALPAQLSVGTQDDRLLLVTFDGNAWHESQLLAEPFFSRNSVVLAAADVNGDGRVDYTMSGGTERILYANADGSWTTRNFGSWGFIDSVDLVDVDGDGRPDLLMTSRQNYGDPGTVQVERNNGDGTFSPYDVATDAAPYGGAIVADINGDGHPDILQASFDGVELLQSVCATPRVRVEALPAAPADNTPVTLVIHAISTDGFAIGGITISENGKTVGQTQPNLAWDLATSTWISPPLTPGTHTFTITYNDQFGGTSQTTVTVTTRPQTRGRAARH